MPTDNRRAGAIVWKIQADLCAVAGGAIFFDCEFIVESQGEHRARSGIDESVLALHLLEHGV